MNTYEIHGEITKLILSNYEALIDTADLPLVNQYRWKTHNHRNVRRVDTRLSNADGGRSVLRLHRLIMNAKPGQIIDHINGDPLDNRRSNLRFCTNQQNIANSHKRVGCSSQYKGVCWDRRSQVWRAGITVDGRSRSLGYFTDEANAARAYDAKAIELFGEFANPNFQQ